MLLIEHKAPHLYKYDAYREYSWSVDQGAYQPASFIYLSFDGFRNLCRQYDLQLIDDSKSVQAQLERTKLPSSRNFLGLITRIENSQDASNVQNALAEGKNVIVLVPRALLDARYYRDEDRRREALQALIALGISHAEEKLGDSFGYKIWWEEIVTEQRGRLFVSTDGSLSDLHFFDGYGVPIEPQEQIKNLVREFSIFKYPVIGVDIQPDIPAWPCHELLNLMATFTNYGPKIRDVEVFVEVPESFEPIGSIERVISRLNNLEKTSFILPLIPRADGNFQNAITVTLSSVQHDAISLAHPYVNIKITPSSGTSMLYQIKQDDLGLTTLQSIFRRLPDFPEIKKLPLLARTDHASCLNKMRIIAVKLTTKALKKKGIALTFGVKY